MRKEGERCTWKEGKQDKVKKGRGGEMTGEKKIEEERRKEKKGR